MGEESMKNRAATSQPWFLCVALILGVAAHAGDAGIDNLRQTGKAFAQVAREASPSVVFIQVEGKAVAVAIGGRRLPFGDEWPFGDDLFRRFFGDPLPGLPQSPVPQGERVIGQGSGFVFAARDGLLVDKTYILTNNHVVENAEKIRVTVQDGREFEARITGRDPQSDLALVEINTIGLPALRWGDSSQLEVGEWVVAIGNPFGLSHTLTVGVVSAKGRTSVGISDYEDFIQTDAAINPGNSGGPLVNLEGDVVGINTAIFSRSGGYMGVGFAIPSNLAIAIANQLLEHGEVTRGYLGVVIQALTPELARSFDMQPGQGVLVAQVSEASPAAAAGLRPGDVIVEFRGEPVTDVGSFRNRVSLTPPATTEALTILRDGKRKTLRVTFGRLTEAVTESPGAVQGSAAIGLTVQTLTPQMAEQLDATPGQGVVVTEVMPGSVAARSGIETGSIILQVNRVAVTSAADFQRAVERGAADKRLLLLVRQGRTQRYVALNW
jgi:serine protease Do